MSENIVKFDKGINRLVSANVNFPFDLSNCRIEPFNEVKAWRGGTFPYPYPRQPKPWVNVQGNWWTGTAADDYSVFQERLFLTKQSENRYAQITDLANTEEIDFTSFPYLAQVKVDNNLLIDGSSLGYRYLGWDVGTEDTIRGITFDRAVDYIAIPLDEFGQSGPWTYFTFYNNHDAAVGAKAIQTVIPEFRLSSTFDYDTILIYRTIEYDLEAVTDELDDTFGYFFEGIVNATGLSGTEPMVYRSESYWPFNLTEDVGLSERLGTELLRGRNLWSRTPITTVTSGSFIVSWTNLGTGIFARQPSGKQIHLDAGVMNMGNLMYPTKTPHPSFVGDPEDPLNLTNEKNTVWFQYEYGTPNGKVYGAPWLEEDATKVIIPWEGENALLVWMQLELPVLTGATGPLNQFTVADDYTSLFKVGAVFEIAGSGTAANNQEWTVVSSSFGGGITTIKVEGTVTNQGASGTLYVLGLWERLTVDGQGRYRTRVHDDTNDKPYTFIAEASPETYFQDSSLTSRTGYETITDYFQLKSSVFLSTQNAPWEISFDNFSVPDGSEIRSLIGARLEEVEQIRGYTFYAMSETAAWAVERSGRDNFLTNINGAPGVKLGVDDTPMAVSVRGGVAYTGIDEKLYFLTGRQVTQLDYEFRSTGGLVITDMAYDVDENRLVVVTSNEGVLYYDLDRNVWSGQREIAQTITGYQKFFLWQHSGAALTTGTQINGDIVTTEDVQFTSGELLARIPQYFIALLDSTSGAEFRFELEWEDALAATTTVAQWLFNGSREFELYGGELFTSPGTPIDVPAGDTLRLTVVQENTIFSDPTELDIEIFARVTSNESATIERIAYDPSNLVITAGYDNDAFELLDETGAVLPAGLVMQPIRTTASVGIDAVKFDYESNIKTGTYSTIEGSNVITITGGDEIVDPDDVGAFVILEDAGESGQGSGSAVDLTTLVKSINSVTEFVIADWTRIADLLVPPPALTGTLSWATPATFTITLDQSSTFRDRTLGPFKVQSGRLRYPKNTTGRNVTLSINGFETLREVFIFTEIELSLD